MAKIAYLDPFGGAAGDMVLAALVDAGADEPFVRRQLAGLDLPGWSLTLSQRRHQGFAGLRAEVEVTDASAPARRLENVRNLLAGAALDSAVRDRALAVFQRLFEAEAAVHGVALEAAHLHEIAAVDAVVDIVGACAALHSLAVDEVVCGPVPVGRGTVATQHGLLPVPPPAVARLLEGVPLAAHGTDGEMTTPTGAALLTTWCERYEPLPGGRLVRVGIGLGSRRFEGMPNVFRVFVLEAIEAEPGERTLDLVEAAVDDRTGEELAFLVERLRAAGAREAWLLSGTGRKGRPLVEVRALTDPETCPRILEVFFSEGMTLGARVVRCRRPELSRRVVAVTTPYGVVPVKVAGWRGRVVSAKPEADVCQELARTSGQPLALIQAAACAGAPHVGDEWAAPAEP